MTADKEPDEQTVLESLEQRVQNLEQTISGAASSLEQFTSARKTAIQSALNDIALNIQEGADELEELINRAKDGEISSKRDLASAVLDVADKDRVAMTSGAAAGAYIGSFGGPIGAILGAAAGPSAVYLGSVRDNRRIVAVPLDEGDIPSVADPLPSNQSPIVDCQPIQTALNRALDSGEAADETQRLTRTIDFDDVDRRLSELEYVETDADDLYDGYYIEHDGVVFVVFLDES